MKNLLLVLVLFLGAITYYACGGSSNGITTSDAFSSAGVISSPFAVSTSNSQIDLSARLLSSKYGDIKKSIDDMLAVATGKIADCQKLFVIDLKNLNSKNANCYGPEVRVTGDHPNDSVSTAVNELRPTGDLGIWDATDSSGEACASAQVTALTNYAAASPFYGQLLAAYAYCYVNNSGGTLAMPTGTGNTTFAAADLTAYGFTSGKDELTASSLVITSITNTAGDPGFRFEISGTMKDGDTTPSATTIKYKIITQYAKSSAGAQSGTSSYEFTNETGGQGNCTPGNGVVYAGKETFALNAAGTSDTVMLKHAEYCGKTATPLNATTYDIDFSVKNPTANGWGGNANYLLFSFNPSTLDGSYVYAWQAGPLDNNSRIFNAAISTASSTQTGTGYVGFGEDIQTTASLGVLKGMICNWTGTGNAHTYAPTAGVSVQSQEMTKNATTGVWTPTASHIQFAPVVECGYTRASFPTFAFDSTSTSGTMSNDSTHLGSASGTVDLTLLSAVKFTAPTAPSF